MSHVRKRKKLKRNNPEWVKRLETADASEADVHRDCVLGGLMLKVSQPRSGRTVLRHWQFCDGRGWVVVHYWPTNGRYRSVCGRWEGFTDEPTELIDLSQAILTGTANDDHRYGGCPDKELDAHMRITGSRQ
jgi:hypothetical protein